MSAACSINGGALAAARDSWWLEGAPASAWSSSPRSLALRSCGGGSGSVSSSSRMRLLRQNAAVCCTMASTVSNKTKDRSNPSKGLSMLEDFRAACATPVDSLWNLVDEMIQEMQAGLEKEGGGRMRMLLTFVDNLPKGNEKGTYYALDLGGTNFRVLRVQLGGAGGRITSESRELAIPQELMHGTNQELFDFIAGKLADFAREDASAGKKELGFTFSFPIHQTSINSGYLINWTKGFTVPDTVGKDVVQELEAAIARQGLEMHVTALVNDTVGTLVRGHHTDKDVMISVILGTGTNACYVERADVIGKYKGKGIMVINTEWGSSWSDNLPRADVDEELDAESVNPGDQFFEKLVSGMYLGEILRRFLLKLATEAQVFGEEVPEKLSTPHTLSTPMMCTMHHDKTADLHEVERILREALGISKPSLEAKKLVVQACDVIAERAARLAGAGIVGLLSREVTMEMQAAKAAEGSMAQALRSVLERVHKAAERSGRVASQINVVAVSKTKPVTMVKEAYEAGHRHFGENYVQELLDKAPQLPEDIKWHFIGHLQSNKAKPLVAEVPNLYMVEGVDSSKVANHLDKAVALAGRKPLKVLVQVNTSGEESKSGVEPSGCVDLAKHIKLQCPNLEFSGLMTIGMLDYTSTPENFKTLLSCREDVCKALGIQADSCGLSMGMSGDFELAIEMGSTNVRVGSIIFGAREYPAKK